MRTLYWSRTAVSCKLVIWILAFHHGPITCRQVETKHETVEEKMPDWSGDWSILNLTDPDTFSLITTPILNRLNPDFRHPSILLLLHEISMSVIEQLEIIWSEWFQSTYRNLLIIELTAIPISFIVVSALLKRSTWFFMISTRTMFYNIGLFYQ